jgi:2-polyprenyl-6-methoxyphenol hydroxylase-like FAD-dependent oxidoreductase
VSLASAAARRQKEREATGGVARACLTSGKGRRVMRVAILGAGPAGLYIGYLIKRRRPDVEIRIARALPAYEAARRPIVEKLVAAANASAGWYERFADHMQLAPIDLAISYITRSGRVDRVRLRAVSPRFVAQVEAARPGAALATGDKP